MRKVLNATIRSEEPEKERKKRSVNESIGLSCIFSRQNRELSTCLNWGNDHMNAQKCLLCYPIVIKVDGGASPLVNLFN